MPKPNRGPYLDVNRTGFYEIRWTDRGRSKSRSTGTRDFQQAQKVLANFLMLQAIEQEAPTPKGDAPMLVLEALGNPEEESEATESYWHEHVLREVVGVETQRYAVRKLNEHFGLMLVRDIRPIHVTGYIDKRRKGKIGKPSKDSTIARELSVLNAAIAHQVRAKRLSSDDAPTIELPEAGEAKDRWLTHAEADRLLEAAMEGRSAAGRLPRVYKFVIMALATASRKTALLELRKDQIDMERGMIRLNPRGRKQTKKKRPLVPVSDDLRPILKRILDEAVGEYVLEHPGSIRTAFDLACARAGLEDVTPHTLRHTSACWMAQAGVPLHDIAAILGDTYATVEKNYLHHCPEHLRGAVNAIRLRAA